MTDIAPRASAPSVFSFESTAVRTFADDHGEPWFLANDVCAVLGYKQPRDAVSKHCRQGGVAKRDTPTDSGIQEMTWINEGNLYRLIIKSRKPEAERFEIWVMEEVLPTIRKTGQYVAQSYAQNPGDALTTDQADVLRQLLTDAAKARFPDDGKKQGAFLMRGWSRLKSHFKVGYREIPQAEFAEAISLLARHIAEGELVDEPPQRVLMVMRGKQIISSQVVNGSCVIDPKSGPDLISLVGEFVPFERLQDVINTAHRRIMNRFESIQRAG